MSNLIKLSSPATREFWEIPVLLEDESVLVLDKPPMLLTSPNREEPSRPSLMKLLHSGISGGAPWASQRGLSYLVNAHRMDCETSGALLLAKSKPVLIELANLFGSAKVTLEFLALVEGTPSKEEILVEAKLAPHPTAAGLMASSPWSRCCRTTTWAWLCLPI